MFKINLSEGAVTSVTQVASFKPYGETIDSPLALGIREVAFSRNKHHLLAGYFDNKMRVYNALTWREIFSFDHNLEELTEMNTPEVVNIYSETDTKDQHGAGTYYEAMARPYELPQLNSV